MSWINRQPLLSESKIQPEYQQLLQSRWERVASCRASVLTCDLCAFSSSDEQEAVQKRTFTKWINSHLAKVSRSLHPRCSCYTAITHHSTDCVAHRAHVKLIVKAITSHAKLTFFYDGGLFYCSSWWCSFSLVVGLSGCWPVTPVNRTIMAPNNTHKRFIIQCTQFTVNQTTCFLSI